MGKSYRNVYAGSNSVSYHSDHDRGFAKKKKRHSHKQFREINNKCDDEINNKTFKPRMCMNDGCGSGYHGPVGNIPNMPYENILICEKRHSEKIVNWVKGEKTILETIKNSLETIKNSFETYRKPYLIDTIKQLERRNKIGFFYGFKKDKVEEI